MVRRLLVVDLFYLPVVVLDVLQDLVRILRF